MSKQTISEAAVEVGQNWLLWFMGGFGLSFMDTNELIAGLFLAVGGASIMGRARKDPRKIWFLILIAVFAGIVTAQMWPYIGLPWPVQFGMAAAGMASSWFVNLFVKVGNAVEGQSDLLITRLIDRFFPPTKKD